MFSVLRKKETIYPFEELRSTYMDDGITLTSDSYTAIGLCYLEFLYAVGCEYLQKQQYQKALGWFREAAKPIYPRAEYQIGYMYDRGWGVKKDYKMAMEWYRKSARNGNSNAMCQIGYLYHKGQGVPRDYKMAMEWYSKSSDSSHSQNNIGIIYKRGQGVPKDMFAAMKWYTKAAQQGNTVAQYNLAFNYEFINKVKDPQQAVNWYKRAADNGCAISKVHLYLMRMRGHSPQEDHQDIDRYLDYEINREVDEKDSIDDDDDDDDDKNTLLGEWEKV